MASRTAYARMPRRLLLLSVLALAGMLVLAISAAAVPETPIGARINVLLGTPTTFPANQPFHVAHGWITTDPASTPPAALGLYSVTLELDGEPMAVSVVERFVDEDGTLQRRWVFNFPVGLSAGTHVFTVRWWGPCQGLVDSGYDPGGPCAKPNELRVANGPLTRSVEVRADEPRPRQGGVRVK